jgi:hypothetical protein
VTIVMNLASGWALPRINYYMPIYLVGGLFTLLGGVLLYVYLEPTTSVATIYGLTIITAFGGGVTQQLGYTIAAIKAFPTGDVVHALNFQNFSQIGATTISLVIAGQIFQTSAVDNLSVALKELNLSRGELQDAVTGAQSALFASLEGELREAAVRAVTGAIQKAFILVIVAGALETVAGALLKFERLFQDTAAETTGSTEAE